MTLLPGKPFHVEPELWADLSRAYFGAVSPLRPNDIPDPAVRAHLDMWLHGRWSFEQAIVALAVHQTKGLDKVIKLAIDLHSRHSIPLVVELLPADVQEKIKRGEPR